jgi:hypothetical protein
VSNKVELVQKKKQEQREDETPEHAYSSTDTVDGLSRRRSNATRSESAAAHTPRRITAAAADGIPSICRSKKKKVPLVSENRELD